MNFGCFRARALSSPTSRSKKIHRYGAEPVLHANEVKAAIRLFSLWRGRLEISRISVDEASLNLVRTARPMELDTLFRSAAQVAARLDRSRRRQPLPYLEATNSRINIKRDLKSCHTRW